MKVDAFWRVLGRIVPTGRARWIAAMYGEAAHLPAPYRLGWMMSAVYLVLVLLARAHAASLLATGWAALLILVDWTDGGWTPALTLMSLAAFTLGRIGAFRLALLTAAGTLPLAHTIANFVPSLRPFYQFAPLTLTDWLVLSSVAVIGFALVKIMGIGARFLAWEP